MLSTRISSEFLISNTHVKGLPANLFIIPNLVWCQAVAIANPHSWPRQLGKICVSIFMYIRSKFKISPIIFCILVFCIKYFHVFIWYQAAAPHSWRRQLGELISNFSARLLVGSANFAGFRNSRRWVVCCHTAWPTSGKNPKGRKGGSFWPSKINLECAWEVRWWGS